MTCLCLVFLREVKLPLKMAVITLPQKEKIMLELTETIDQAAIENNYPSRLTYRQEEFFDNIYMGRLLNKADRSMPKDSQESYLGYIPDEDVFVSGFDTWQEFHESPNIIFLQIEKNGNVKDVTTRMVNKFQIEEFYSTMMYGKNGMYKHLKESIPNLLDIRLD